MAKNKKSRKGKRIGIIAGAAAIGSAIGDAILILTTPMTGGLSLGALALKKSTEIGIAAGAGAIGGAAIGTIGTKVSDKKKETAAYGKGYSDASEVYEAKFAAQAKAFTKEAEKWDNYKNTFTKDMNKRDEMLRKCLQYIKDLEKERDYLKKNNQSLSKEKEELLKSLKMIQRNLVA